MYIELHTASAFSFLDGASLPEALVARAAALGYSALGLLDRDGVYGAPRFHLAAKKAGLKAIIGAELTISTAHAAKGRGSDAVRVAHVAPLAADSVFKLPVLIESRAGYRNLCRLVTTMKLRSPTSFPRGDGAPPQLQRSGKSEGALTLDEIDGHTSGLIALAGRSMLSGPRFGVGGLVDRLVGVFGRGNTYLELQRHLLRDEEADNHALRDLAAAFHVPIIATNGVRFAEPADRPLYDVLTCIRHKTTVERAGRRLTCNAERYLKPPEQMAKLFADVPLAVSATRELADRIGYTMADLGYRFPEYPVPAGETMASFLRKITQAGARERYRPIEPRHTRQLERELDLIEKLDLAGYFLIVWDIVNFCRQQGILVQGRGSAANSAVCYSLGITAVDPIGMDLLFERFLSEQRGEWPDIDLDLPSGDRRERVIQHVYEQYGGLGAAASQAWTASEDPGVAPAGPRAAPGGPRAAMTANVITYRSRSAAREVGKVLGLDEGVIDTLAKVMNRFEWVDPKETLERNFRDAGISAVDPTIQLFGQLWSQIQDLPRHLGQHSGGMVVCQGRLDEVVPLENASMPNRVVIQWDKDDCADMGIVKVDLLGLGMMAVLQDALQILDACPVPAAPCPTGSEAPAPAPCPLDLAQLPPNDPVVYRMLQEADTIGIFQVESRAQMATLPRLRPKTFYDIVVEVAIIRPGPIVGQMVHPYLKRRQGQEPVVYPHPSLQPILERTLGVPLFQEQLLRMAMVAAGFSGGEAEELRRAFGFKRSERRMQEIEKKLRTGMTKQGITGDAAEEIIRSITSFALYGFPESHAASFALLVYASAYLKAHYPAAFYTSMLNNQPMGFYHPSTLVKDAQRHGVRFAPVDVQVSDWACRVETDGRVRLGLMYVNGLRREVGEAIAAAEDRDATDVRGAMTDERGASRDVYCPKCGNDDASMLETLHTHETFCNVCSYVWPRPTGLRSPSSIAQRPASIAHRPSSSAHRPSSIAHRLSPPGQRFASLDDFIRRTGIRRDEVATLASIGALNAFGFDRRTALWQIEQAIRPAGELFEDARGVNSQLPTPNSQGGNAQLPTPNSQDGNAQFPTPNSQGGNAQLPTSNSQGGNAQLPTPNSQGGNAQLPTPNSQGGNAQLPTPNSEGGNGQGPGTEGVTSPLAPMTVPERLLADYAGTSLTIGPHPMSLRRAELALRGVLRASDLPLGRHGRRVRVAGAVITRQRPGTAKGFVFLTLEDETGIANVIVRPDLFSEQRAHVVGSPYLLVEGTLQIQEGVTSVKAERVQPLGGGSPPVDSHDFR